MHKFFSKNCILLLALFLLCSCSSGNSNSEKDQHSNIPSPTTTSSPVNPTSTPTPVPTVETSCPAEGTARTAVMPPLQTSNHPAIIYISNADPGGGPNTTSSTLKRYDITNNATTNIITPISKRDPASKIGVYITDAQLSTNGQWVIFQTLTEGKRGIQLVRIDGQERQTLYCSPVPLDPRQEVNAGFINFTHLTWSPDQKYIAFSQLTTPTDNQNDSTELYILDITTGKLQLELKPLSNTQSYNPIKWANNKSLYVTDNATDNTRSPRLDLLTDITKDVSQQSTNLQEIKIAGWDAQFQESCPNLDISPDGMQVLTSSCTTKPTPQSNDEKTGPSVINLQARSDGKAHQIYQDNAHAIINARFISDSAILFIIESSQAFDSSQNGLWKINTDGTGLTRLSNTETDNHLNFTQHTTNWGNISRDSTMYAISITGNTTSLMTGSVNGGSQTIFDVEPPAGGNNAKLVGWTTF